ncbi:MAG: hypothetical protein K6L75_09985 [Cellvibrionaceae bacterium]
MALLFPRWFQYSFYLACSWLWCIGAFFPLIILRDYGIGALIGFTTFNVVGAAAFAFYFTEKKRRLFIQQHQFMLNIFSGVTAIFQIFFVAWLSQLLGMYWLLPLMLSLALLFYMGNRLVTVCSIALYFISLIFFAIFSNSATIDWSHQLQLGWTHVLLPLAMGFMFSPYLDLTFHRAFQQSEKPKFTFVLGFGVFFLSLVCFVFAYSSELTKLFFDGDTLQKALYPIVAFIILQTAFTLAVHVREYKRFNNSQDRPIKLWICLSVASLIISLFMMNINDFKIPLISSANVGEIIYKCFLFFYGLVCPIYLLLHTNRRYMVFTLVCISPFYAIGFLIGGQHIYTLSIAMLILFCTAAIVRFKKSTPQT